MRVQYCVHVTLFFSIEQLFVICVKGSGFYFLLADNVCPHSASHTHA